MLRTCVLVLAVFSLVGCGGGTMPLTPAHSGSSGATSSSGSGGGTGTGTSGTGTSGTGSSSITGPSEFTFGGYTWETDSGSAPPVGNANGNVGKFDPMNVSVGSELVLSLTQTPERQPDSVQRIAGHNQTEVQLWHVRVYFQGGQRSFWIRYHGVPVRAQLRDRN